MAYKVLGQSKPATTTNTTKYTVPALKETVLSSLSICNTGTGQDTVRVYIVLSAGSASTSNALYYDLLIDGKDTFVGTIGITLATGDFIVVYSTTGNSCFQAFGSETTA
jgi:hypothetical protein